MYIEQYIESKKHAWAESTKRSELFRLRAVESSLTGDPELLFAKLEYLGPYSRLTTWTRVTQYWEYLIEEGFKTGPNPYKVWRKKNARVFKNCYTKNKPTITYQEAEALIEKELTGDVQKLALQILHSGLRFNESRNFEADKVRGKGNKERQVYLHDSEQRNYNNVPYHTLSRGLAKIGLKIHDLRKLFLNRLVELGANPFELCEVAGWASIETASSYIKVNNDKIRELVSRI